MATFTDNRGPEGTVPSEENSGVVVLGAGRSGTSAIARAFVKSGFFAGEEEELHPADSSNPLGYYESLALVEANEGVLKSFGRRWWSDAPSPDEQLSQRAEIEPRLSAVVHRLIRAADGAPIVIKDPRINGLLPLWQPVVNRSLHPVLVVRNPIEIALSHAQHDGTPIGHALAAWEVQATLVLRLLHGMTITVAPHAQVMARAELVNEIVSEATEHLSPDRAERVQPSDAGSAVRRDLHRQKSSGFDPDEYLTVRQAALWDYLGTLSAGDVQLDSPAALRCGNPAALATMRRESDRILAREASERVTGELLEARQHVTALEQRFTEATELARQAVSAASERAEHAEEAAALASRAASEAQSRQTREAAAFQNSTSWRLTAPLRHLKRLLRRSRSA